MLKKTNILIKSEHPIDKFTLTDCFCTRLEVYNNREILLKDRWYCLNIPYENLTNEIKKIVINGVDIQHLIYTGYFENTNGEIFQPATALWEPGNFKLWIHPNVGFFMSTILNQIDGGDYGSNLFEKYMLTVDKSITIDRSFPLDTKEFFAHSSGPKWWRRDHADFPYKTFSNPILKNIDKQLLINEIKQTAETYFCRENVPEWSAYEIKDNENLFSVETIQSPELKKLLKIIGYESIGQIHLNGLDPFSQIPLHKDNDIFGYGDGFYKFYWNLSDSKDIYFKFSGLGCLPIDEPLTCQTNKYAHAVVNNSNEERFSLLVYGVLGEKNIFY